MPEQSIGMSTGLGDGVAGGYPASRMLTMETGMAGSGVFLYGNNLAATGVGSASLSINDGAALVSGYYYENTSATVINVSTLANGTYNLIIVVNATAGTLAVARSATGTTTAAYSVRLALFSGVPAAPYVILGTVTVAAAVVSAINPTYAQYASTRQVPYQSYATMSGGTATLTVANTTYDVTGYSSSSSTNEAIFSTNTTTGEITVRRTGAYNITTNVIFQSGTTGNRVLAIAVNGSNVATNRTAASGSANSSSTQTTLLILASGDVVKVTAASSIATQTVSSAIITIAWA